jgi:hypothetical protein
MAATVDQRFVTGVAVTALWESIDADGEPVAPGATPTVAAVRSSTGAAITIAAAVAAVSGSTTKFSVAVTATELGLTLDRFTITWSVSAVAVATTTIELVGGVYFPTRTAYERYPKEITAEKYTAAEVLDARRATESEFEAIASRAFVPRYAEETVTGKGRAEILVSEWDIRTIIAVYLVASDGTETVFTAAELAELRGDASGAVIDAGGDWTDGSVYRICYTYGLTRPPVEIINAALERLRFHAGRSASLHPVKANTFTSENGGTYGLATAGARKTGNDDIDAVLMRHGRRSVTVA